jgi:hypothetical protein
MEFECDKITMNSIQILHFQEDLCIVHPILHVSVLEIEAEFVFAENAHAMAKVFLREAEFTIECPGDFVVFRAKE